LTSPLLRLFSCKEEPYIVKKLIGAGLGLALLFGCAASPAPAPKEEQTQAEPAQCLTSEALRQGMAQSGVAQKADLEGEPFDAFIEWLTPHLNTPIPAGLDRVLIFEQEGVALIVLMKEGCVAGHMTGPWEPIKAFLLSRPHV
jgi:hypothetical protein